MLPEWMVIGFSGHRKLPDPAVAAAGIRGAIDRLAATHGPLASVSSAAAGGDTLFVEEVARRNFPYLLVLPFARSRFQQDFEPADWQRILPFIEKAARVEEVAGEESPEGAYMETGIQTVDRADVMIVIWNEKPSAGFGGTGDVVAYARELGKPLLIIDPVSGKISDERLDRLPHGKSLPADWSRNPRETVEKHLKELDDNAKHHAPKSRHLVLNIILFQLAASAVGLIALTFEIHGRANQLIMLSELILLGIAFAFLLQHHRKSSEWLKSRIEAELCRSFLATWDLRRRADYFPKISLQEFSPLCRNVRLIRSLDKTPGLPLESARDGYLEKRVQDQLKYFSRECSKARTLHRKLHSVASAATAIAAMLSLLALVLSLLNFPVLVFAAPKYLSLVLPLISAAFFSLVITQDYSRRAGRYGEMAAMLENAAKRLKMVQTWNGLARIAAETEEELMQEIIEWRSFRQFAGSPH